MTNPPIDYFAPARSLKEAVLRRIKGDYRRQFIDEVIRKEGLDSIPAQWTMHELDELFKRVLMSRNPRNRGGEDLPNLEDGEVEIARVCLVDTVHGEVISLRAHKSEGLIQLRLIDEYQTEFELPTQSINHPFTSAELIEFLSGCDPCPFDNECTLRISSPFHQGLQELMDDLLKHRRKDQP